MTLWLILFILPAVLAGLLPESLQPISTALERYDMFLFFILLLSGAMRFLT